MLATYMERKQFVEDTVFGIRHQFVHKTCCIASNKPTFASFYRLLLFRDVNKASAVKANASFLLHRAKANAKDQHPYSVD